MAPGYPSKADTAANTPWDTRASAVMGAFADWWKQKKGIPVTTYDGSASAGNFALLSDWFQTTKPVPPGGLPVLPVGPGGKPATPAATSDSGSGTIVMVLGGAALLGLVLFAAK